MRARWKDYTKKTHQQQEHLNLDFGALRLDIHIWALDSQKYKNSSLEEVVEVIDGSFESLYQAESDQEITF